MSRIALVALILASSSPASARTWIVDGKHAQADDRGEGTAERPFRSIGAGARSAQPGDTVLVSPGVYRERVAPVRGGEAGRPIVYKSAEPGKAVIRGSDILAPQWEREAGAGTVFSGRISPTLFLEENPFQLSINIDGEDKSTSVRPANGKLRPVLGEVFLDGRPYDQVTRAEDLKQRERCWMVSADGARLLVHFPTGTDPGKYMVEITTRNRIFAPHRRGLGHIHVSGFVFEHCANQGPFPQAGAVSVRSGHHWVIEGNVIRYAATIGLDCGGEYWDGNKIPDAVPADRRLLTGGHHLIRDNDVSDNGLCGIAGWTARDVRIEHNRVERNNRRGFPIAEGGWEEWAGIKLHNSNAVIRCNLIRDNLAFGIWLDNGYADARVDANVLLRNQGAGVFVELGASPGHPCHISNNVVAGTTAMKNAFYPGFGIYAHDASDMIVAHNLVFDNTGAGLLMRTITDRQAGGKPAETSRSQIVNNLVVNNAGGTINLPYPNQRSSGLILRHNVYWMDAPATEAPFAINKYQGQFKLEEVAQELQRRVAASAIPEQRLPEPNLWVKNPRLTFAQWRLLTQTDAHSRWDKIAVRCDDRTLPAKLQLTVAPSALDLSCPRAQGVDQDFRGEPIPQNKAMAGPFQGLRTGENAIPLEFTRRAPEKQ